MYDNPNNARYNDKIYATFNVTPILTANSIFTKGHYLDMD